MQLITVVMNKKTKKIYPFRETRSGEILITYSGVYNIDDLIVTRMDVSNINWETGYANVEILDE